MAIMLADERGRRRRGSAGRTGGRTIVRWRWKQGEEIEVDVEVDIGRRNGREGRDEGVAEDEHGGWVGGSGKDGKNVPSSRGNAG